jgi:quinolinate synthase
MLLANYADLSAQELDERIARAKGELGSRLVILGHHYQRDEVVKFADYRGDSLRLSQLAARRPEAEYIVFCGVHFMAESADILSGDDQTVILPDLHAGCSMADMANLEQVEVCWEALTAANSGKVVPVTYINSTAAIKAFVGRNGGAVCTSSNARKVMEWALARGEKALFLPDEHLGRNTGYGLGIPLERWRYGIRMKKMAGSLTIKFAMRGSICGKATAPFTCVFAPNTWSACAGAIPAFG